MDLFVEPCCFRKQLSERLDKPFCNFFTNGDVTLDMFLDFLVGLCPGAAVSLALVRVEQATLNTLVRLMERRNSDGSFLIHSLVLVSTGQDRAAVSAALAPFRTEGRAVVCEERVAFRCLAVANDSASFVLQGSIGQTSAFLVQMISMATDRSTYEGVASLFALKQRHKAVKS
jgi:hypothetical protein